GGQDLLVHRRTLVRVVQRDVVDAVLAVPRRDRRAGLDRVVEVHRRRVLVVDAYRGGGVRRVHVALRRVGFGRRAVDPGRAVPVRMVVPEPGVELVRLVLDVDEFGGGARDLGTRGDGERDELAPEVHLVVLQHPQLEVRGLALLRNQAHRVLVSDDAHAFV